MLSLDEMRTVLVRVDFPATRDEIIARARRTGAPDELLQRLAAIPRHMYGSVNTVMETLRPAA